MRTLNHPVCIVAWLKKCPWSIHLLKTLTCLHQCAYNLAIKMKKLIAITCTYLMLLPSEVASAATLQMFKSNLKTHLFSASFSSSWLLRSDWSAFAIFHSKLYVCVFHSYLILGVNPTNMVVFRLSRALAGPSKSLNFFFQIFKVWKVLENRHGPWKSLNLCLKVLESAWIRFSKTPWLNKWLLSRYHQMLLLGSNATEMH